MSISNETISRSRRGSKVEVIARISQKSTSEEEQPSENEGEEQIISRISDVNITDPNPMIHESSSVISAAVISHQSEQECLSHIFDFEFDALQVEKRPLLFNQCVQRLIQSTLDGSNNLEIDAHSLSGFISEVWSKYNADNPYHNACHSLSVTHVTGAIISRSSSHPRCTWNSTPLDRLCLVISALCHDILHDGFTNGFHIAAQSPIAVLYNDQSVLENQSICESWRMIIKHDLLRSFSKEDRKEFRKQFIRNILATDMAHHKQLLDDASEVTTEAILHSADLGHSILPWNLTYQWSRRLFDEFNRQTHKEEEMGLPSIPFMKETKLPRIAKEQIFFQNMFVKPLWTKLNTDLFSKQEKGNLQSGIQPNQLDLSDRLSQLEINQSQWESLTHSN